MNPLHESKIVSENSPCCFRLLFNTATLSRLLLHKPKIVSQHVSGHDAYC